MEINNELKWRVYRCSREHGFYNKEYSNKYYIMLIVKSLAEIIDIYGKERHAHARVDVFKECLKHSVSYNGNDESEKRKTWEWLFEREIKDTVEDKLACVFIRCLDFCGFKGFNLDDFGTITSNSGYFGENIVEEILDMVTLLTDSIDNKSEFMMLLFMETVFNFATFFKIDINWHIEQRLNYNELRPMPSSGKY
jgi:hypothetical protein